MHSSQRFLYSFVVNVANYPSNWVVMSDRSVGDLRFLKAELLMCGACASVLFSALNFFGALLFVLLKACPYSSTRNVFGQYVYASFYR